MLGCQFLYYDGEGPSIIMNQLKSIYNGPFKDSRSICLQKRSISSTETINLSNSLFDTKKYLLDTVFLKCPINFDKNSKHSIFKKKIFWLNVKVENYVEGGILEASGFLHRNFTRQVLWIEVLKSL